MYEYKQIRQSLTKYTALKDLFETRFEILRVSAFCRHQKIENWSILNEATDQNENPSKIASTVFLIFKGKNKEVHFFQDFIENLRK